MRRRSEKQEENEDGGGRGCDSDGDCGGGKYTARKHCHLKRSVPVLIFFFMVDCSSCCDRL